jgi:hypothetical protein
VNRLRNLVPLVAMLLGACIGSMFGRCAFCETTYDNLPLGKFHDHKCWMAVCQSGSPATGNCLHENCSTCGDDPAGGAWACPYSGNVCDSKAAAFCTNRNGC